jgi:aminomethyltransferase
MGYVTRDFAAAGTSVEIEVRGKRIAATVSLMPFIPNRYHRKGKTA